jgi:hypothetical protein
MSGLNGEPRAALARAASRWAAGGSSELRLPPPGQTGLERLRSWTAVIQEHHR